MCEDVGVTDATPTAPEAQSETPSWHVPRLIAAWVITAIFGVLVAVLVPGDARFEWLALAVGASTLVTFALQLGTAQREGFISRTSFSVAGAVLIIAVVDMVCVLFG